MLNFTQPRLRFAPSPNGYLHLGHAYSALVNAHFSQKLDGKLLLRIEDIDQPRCTEAYEKAIIEDLQWLEIPFETPFRKQSEHFSIYQNALEKLISTAITGQWILTALLYTQRLNVIFNLFYILQIKTINSLGALIWIWR